MTSCNADHPRACGANHQMSIRVRTTYGSSPRVRGKRTDSAAVSCTDRIIPARAGQTPPACTGARRTSDHPRACGANCAVLAAVAVAAGSSPRVRGKQPVGVNYHYRQRIIPARAGQTSFAVRCAEVMSDHPRACGANDLSFTDLRGADGSSPRVRGKLLHGRLLRRQRRIIPARAGQTSACVRTSPTRSDHPRACGANPFSGLAVALIAGSSPRVRGKQDS